MGEAPAGESQFDVEERVAAFVDSLLEKTPADEPGSKEIKTVAVFMHGVAIRCYLRRLLGAGTTAAIHMHTDNTCISEILYRNGPAMPYGWQIVRINDSA